MAKQILIIEDEGTITGLLSRKLRQKGYGVATLDSEHALQQARKHSASLILLEAPTQSGEISELCRRIRDTVAVPILVLCEPSTDMDDVEGVECLTKPVDFRALLKLVDAALSRRRSSKGRSSQFLRRGDLSLDLKTHCLLKGDQRCRLTPKEFSLLKLFMSHPGRLLDHGMIMKEVWNTEWAGDIRTLHVHISWIRKKIEDTPGKPERLRTVRGVGYRFEPKR